MDTTEVRQSEATSPTDDELRAWDWRAELKRQERTVTWLARRTDRSPGLLHTYARGAATPPAAWLRAAAIALDWRPSDAE